MPYEKVAGFIGKLREREATVALALEFLAAKPMRHLERGPDLPCRVDENLWIRIGRRTGQTHLRGNWCLVD